MSDLLMLDGAETSGPPSTSTARKGLVRANNKVVFDDDGIFHPLGLTFFWALFGWKYERERVMAHLKWFATKGFDYLRILGECDWERRSWSPLELPDYAEVLKGFVDAAYDHGLRSEVTIVGGRQYDKTTGKRRFIPATLAAQVAQALEDRAHKVMLYECANEWSRLDKVSMNDLGDMGEVLSQWPNLVSLSAPSGEEENLLYAQHAADDDYYVPVTDAMLVEDKPETYGYEDMIAATKAAGCHGYTIHPRRSSHDHGWSHVRQGYDFKDFPGATFNNEPEGPSSSVVSMTDPLQLVCCRLLGIMCGGAGYVLHVGQGVTGLADPAHNRPNNMWEVPGIDIIMAAVRSCDNLMPLGVENWTCVNNGRSNHPLKLDPVRGFWDSGAGDRAPAVNKNYAAITNDRFVVMLTGVKSSGFTGPVPAGVATRPCHVAAIDPLTHDIVVETDLAAGQGWTVPGRGDTMAAYVVRGTYL